MKKNNVLGIPWLKFPAKGLMGMRLTTALVLLFCVQAFNTVYSQQKMVTLKMQNASVKELLQEIGKQTDFNFIYEDEKVDLSKRVNVDVVNKSVEEVLKQVLTQQGISYSITENNLIIINPKEKPAGAPVSKHPVNGKVLDSTGAGLPGVTVNIKGTTNGVVTNIDGEYSLADVPSNATLQISFIGMQTQEIAVGNQSVINTTLIEDIVSLNEVVAVGYGSVRKKDLTGSVVSISSKDVATLPVASVGGALQGKAAGVQVINSGTPGSDVTFRIRGTGTINNNNPLIVIDGVPTMSGLDQLSASDIETYQILKDASATAIYGSRGANGVVIITTKQGAKDKSSIDFNGYYGVQSIANQIDELNASQFASMHNEMMTNNGQIPNPEFADPASLGEGTDWLGELYSPAAIQNYSLSYSGGSNKTNYYVSGSYFSQDGIVLETGFKRYSVKLNSETKVFDNVKFGNMVNLSHDKRYSGDYNIKNTMLALPTQSIYNPDGTYAGPVGTPMYAGDIQNPIGKAKLIDKTTLGYNLIGSIYTEITFLKDFQFKSTYGLQANFWNDRTWSPKYNWTPTPQELSYLSEYSNKSITWNFDNVLTYNKTLDVHKITLMAGTTAQENTFSFVGGSKQKFASDLTQQLSNGQTLPTISGNGSEWALFSYFGRANYAYNDKYLLTATVRRDGSSRFGPENKYGTFPSASAAWRISEEDFFPKGEIVDNAKLRAGYGITGNQEIGNYSFASVLQTASYNFNNSIVPALVPEVMPNPYVQWEQQKQFNLGVDFSFLNQRIELTADGYIKNTDKMLVPMSVPVTTGYSSTNVPWINAGEIQNKGVELTLLTRNFVGDFKWDTNINVSYNKNEVVSINDSVPMNRGSLGLNYNVARLEAGHAVDEFYGYVTDGIFQTQAEVDNYATQIAGSDPYNRTSPGDIRFKDLNSDGVIDDKDRTYLGNPTPSYIFAMTNTFSYKGFDLNIFLQGVYGNEIFNANRIWNEGMAVAYNQSSATLDRWTGEGTSNEMPRAIFNDPNKNTRASDRYIEDGSYLRIKELTLGYSLPKNLIGKAAITNARLYVSASNLYTFTNYSGFDPEVGTNGIDNSTYPVTRTISVGANISF